MAALVARRGLFAATGVMRGGIVLAACGAVPATAPTTETMLLPRRNPSPNLLNR